MKKLVSLLLSAVIFTTFIGCSKNNNNSRLKILASFYPVYIMTLNIVDGVDGVSVESLASQNVGCLHDFQLQTSDMKRIEKANAFIINGAGMETFLTKVASEVPNLSIIDSSEGIKLIPNDKDLFLYEEDLEGEDANSHLWLSVSNYIQQVKNITDGIISLDPENADKYLDNCNKYVVKLEELKADIHNGLKDISKRDIITFHEAFPYFAEEFGLKVVKVINREPNTEPNAKELAETIELVKSTGVKAVFVEPQYPKTAANIIADETHANVYTLDSAVSGKETKDAYIETMRNNLNVLREALK